ncbi:MAG: hypothetical protein M3R49_01735, partial [Chloroflexota bacterium]|nr:hypothetical protein [Chloroflexota bacterium]
SCAPSGHGLPQQIGRRCHTETAALGPFRLEAVIGQGRPEHGDQLVADHLLVRFEGGIHLLLGSPLARRRLGSSRR